MRQNFMRQQHQLVPSDLVGYEISPLRSRAHKMKATGTFNRPTLSQNPKQISQTNIIIKSLKNISSDQSTEDDDTLNRSSKLTAAGSTVSIPRTIKQNSGEERQNQLSSSTLSNTSNIRSLSTGQLQSLQKAKAKINSYQKASINPSFGSSQNLDQQQKGYKQSYTKVKSSTQIMADDQMYNEEEDEDHNIWDDDLLKIRGIDTENWIDTDGKPYTLFHLYKARFGTHPNQREEITNEEVVKMMKRFSRNRRNKNLERFPWDTFADKRVYCDESDIYYDKNFQNFHKMFNAFYNNDQVRHHRSIIKNNFIQKLQLEKNSHIPSIEDEHIKNNESSPTNQRRDNSFSLKKNIRSMSQVGQINQQSQINSGLNSFRIRQVQNNPTQQQPLNSYQVKSQNLISLSSANENQMIPSNMILSKDQSPVKQSPISLQHSQSQVQGNSPLIGFSPIKKVFSQNSNNNDSNYSSPIKKHNPQTSIDQQTFSAMMESAQNTGNKTQQQPSFKYQLISALKNPAQAQEDSYQNFLSQKIKMIQTQKLREQATQISSNQGETRKQSLLKRQSSVNPQQKYASIANTSQTQIANISFAKYSTNDSMSKNMHNSSNMGESFTSPIKKGSYSPVKGRSAVNQTTVGNLLHLRNMNQQAHQPLPFNDLNSVKKINILQLMK